MEKLIDRRNFIKIVGSIGVITLFIPTLNSCKKEKTDTKLFLSDLKKYNLIICDNEKYQAMLVKYKTNGYDFIVNMLDTSNYLLSEVEIFNSKSANAKEDFYIEYSVISDNMALPTFEKYFGLKDNYSIEEVNYVLEITNDLTKNEKIYVKKDV